MIRWLLKLRSIVATYDADRRVANTRMDELEGVIRERTNIAADVGCKSASCVIVVGRYRNNDYIQTFNLRESDLGAMIDRLREMERYGKVARIDGPPVFKAAFRRHSKGYDF